MIRVKKILCVFSIFALVVSLFPTMTLAANNRQGSAARVLNDNEMKSIVGRLNNGGGGSEDPNDDDNSNESSNNSGDNSSGYATQADDPSAKPQGSRWETKTGKVVYEKTTEPSGCGTMWVNGGGADGKFTYKRTIKISFSGGLNMFVKANAGVEKSESITQEISCPAHDIFGIDREYRLLLWKQAKVNEFEAKKIEYFGDGSTRVADRLTGERKHEETKARAQLLQEVDNRK